MPGTPGAPLERALDLAKSHLSPQSGPGKGGFQAVSLEGIRIAAESLNISAREAMIAFLSRDIWPLRFARNRGVFSAREQAKLLDARAAIIGCGGLGGHAASLLARAGVGALTLCDFDVFDESNLNRQLACREDTLGMNKARALGAELGRIASHAGIAIHPAKADPDTLPEILAGAHIALGCLDSLESRFHVEASAHAAGLPFIHGAVAGEEGFALVSRPGNPGLRVFYGNAAPTGLKSAEALLGVPTCAPAAIAALQVQLALLELLGRGAEKPGPVHLDLSAPLLELFEL